MRPRAYPLAQVEPDSAEQELLMGRMIMCPWCELWKPLEDYTALQTPPNYPSQCPPIFKHGGSDGCKRLFALYVPS